MNPITKIEEIKNNLKQNPKTLIALYIICLYIEYQKAQIKNKNEKRKNNEN